MAWSCAFGIKGIMNLIKKMCERNCSVTAILAVQVTLGLLIGGNALAQDQWRQLQDMPVGKWEAGTVVLDEKLYFFGGYTRRE